MSNKYDFNCPHCRKKIDITDFFAEKLEQSQSEIENRVRLKFDKEKKNLLENYENEKGFQQEEIENLKTKIIKEKHNSRLLKSQIENKLREEILSEQEESEKRIENNVREKYELKLKQFQIKENEYKKEIQNLNNKVEGEENRVKGESQELVIEDWLKQEFPQDKVTEIKKGQSGADTLLLVNDKIGAAIGSILIESKRTKNFSNTWIKKLKEDVKRVKSNVGIVVTHAMPTGKDFLHEVDGVWICHYSEYKNLIKVVRKSLIAINSVIKTQEQSSDTKSLIFDYLTSHEFKQIIETIIGSFSNLKISLNKEKMAMNKIWNERETNIDQVINSTAAMYGKMKGIAGQSIEDIDILKLTKE